MSTIKLEPKSSSGDQNSSKLGAKDRLNYNLVNHVIEDTEMNIYEMKILFPFESNPRTIVFATTGSCRTSIYALDTESNQIKCLNSFMDSDQEEVYYTIEWTISAETSEPYLCFGGLKGIIRIVTIEGESKGTLIGHGSSINDLRVHPKKMNMLLSASKDNTMRLWNVDNGALVALFGGVEGHRDQVLSADFNLDGTMLFSCGMDHSLRLWNLKNILEAMDQSNNFDVKKISFPTIYCNFPEFITRDIHSNYVDCVRWFGDLVISKSIENLVVIWKPGLLHEPLETISKTNKNTTIIKKLPIQNCNYWFVRFGIDFTQKIMALGTTNGKVVVWNLETDDPNEIRKTVLTTAKSKTNVRTVCISMDGDYILSSNDLGHVFVWKRNS